MKNGRIVSLTPRFAFIEKANRRERERKKGSVNRRTGNGENRPIVNTINENKLPNDERRMFVSREL